MTGREEVEPALTVGQPDANGSREEAQTEETPTLAREEGVSGSLGELVMRLHKVEEHLAEFHRRAAHRESVIDRMHEENRRLHDGFGRLLLEPVVADLIRLYDQLEREARRLDASGEDGQPLRSFADDVAQILDRCGIEAFSAEPGEPFERGRHRAVGVVACDDESRHNTVAEVVAAGFYERETSLVRRPVQARFHQYSPGGEGGPAPDPAQSQ